MKIVLVVNSLVQGGAQRFTVDFAQELVSLGHSVEIVTFYPIESDFFPIPTGVTVNRLVHPFQDNGRIRPLLLKSKFATWCSRRFLRIVDLLALRRLINANQPELVIAVERYVGILVGLVLPRSTRIIVSERVHPQFHPVKVFWGPIDGLLLRLIFRRDNIFLHAQGLQIAKFIEKEFGKPVMVIPNFVGVQAELLQKQEESKDKTVLSICRFSPQKGIDLLLEAWSLVPRDTKENWKLRIVGDGDRSSYLDLARKKGIQESISLESATTDVTSLLSSADIFILTSRYEGFPNALAEAMSAGLPTIATDCPSAVRELTKNGKLSRLVPIDSTSIAAALEDLMSDEVERDRLGKSGKEVSSLFSVKEVSRYWLDFFEFVSGADICQREVCPVCCTSYGRSSVTELRSRSQIMFEMQTEWNVFFPKMDISSSVVRKYACRYCDVLFYGSNVGDDTFFEACHKSEKYIMRLNQVEAKVIAEVKSNFAPIRAILKISIGVWNVLSEIDGVLEDASATSDLPPIVEFQYSKKSEPTSTLRRIEGIYDLIVLSNILGQVSYPTEFMEQLATLCRRNTLVAVTTMNPSLIDFDPSPLSWPPHNSLSFTPNSQDNFFRRFGFERVDYPGKSENLNEEFESSALYRLSRN